MQITFLYKLQHLTETRIVEIVEGFRDQTRIDLYSKKNVFF